MILYLIVEKCLVFPSEVVAGSIEPDDGLLLAAVGLPGC